jgi:hypothetical protein
MAEEIIPYFKKGLRGKNEQEIIDKISKISGLDLKNTEIYLNQLIERKILIKLRFSWVSNKENGSGINYLVSQKYRKEQEKIKVICPIKDEENIMLDEGKIPVILHIIEKKHTSRDYKKYINYISKKTGFSKNEINLILNKLSMENKIISRIYRKPYRDMYGRRISGESTFWYELYNKQVNINKNIEGDSNINNIISSGYYVEEHISVKDAKNRFESSDMDVNINDNERGLNEVYDLMVYENWGPCRCNVTPVNFPMGDFRDNVRAVTKVCPKCGKKWRDVV